MGERKHKEEVDSFLQNEKPLELPTGFRRLSIEERRSLVSQSRSINHEDFASTDAAQGLLELADVMVESAIGFMPTPLGLASGFLIDGNNFTVPMATEEPSVIAAATYAAHLVAGAGGFKTWAEAPVMTSQIFVEGASDGSCDRIVEEAQRIAAGISHLLSGLQARGGGFRGIEAKPLESIDVIVISLHIDVRDAMGANLLNSLAEAARGSIETITGGRVVMSILSNSSGQRKAGASFRFALSALSKANKKKVPGEEVARRIVLASEIAQRDADRAVTHNKGIMNGISALALATGNDTRAIEGAAHSWASRDGTYRGLSLYRINEDNLTGELELPLPLASVGGAVDFHPTSSFCLDLLGRPSGPNLARIAAALGLAQNFAALLALVTTGIQTGHMPLHVRRLAYASGARGAELKELAEALAREEKPNRARADELLRQMRR